MRFHILTLFPEMFSGPFDHGIAARARRSGAIGISLVNIRDHAHDRHRTVDDYTFGGGPGMLMKPEPLFESVEAVRASADLDDGVPVVLMSPQGRRLTQPVVEELSGNDDLVLVCGRYEGFDERVRRHLATDEISIGDYVLGGGELAAMVLIESVARLVEGVVGSIESTQNDSFATGLLQHPQYTRPAEFRGMKVPDVLLSGDHAEIARWRRREALRRTLKRRPDLLDAADLSDADRRFLDELRAER